MIAIGRIGIESDIELKVVSNMEISMKPNQHTQMILSGVLSKNMDSFHADWEGKSIQILELDIDSHPKEVIFYGIIKKIYVYVENEVSQIIITAFSSSIILDKEEKSHSYQNVEKTYGQLVQETVAHAGGIVNLYSSDIMQIQKPVVQYMETDWEFCKRMASHIGVPLYCNPSSRGVELQVGIEAGKKPVIKIGQEYEANIKSVLPNSQMMLSYEVKDYDNHRIGDLVNTPSGNMYICEKTVVFGRGELQFLYKLCYLKDIHMGVMFNSRIAGMMLEGEVINTEKEKVFVKFDIDGYKGEALYPYPWTPITGNIMYCMPEQGTKVGVYFGSSDEKEASAIVNLQRQGNYAVSAKRVLESKYGKKIHMYSGQLAFKAEPISEKNLALELIDQKKINLQSHNTLHMYSCGNIKLNAPYITVKTPTELHASRTYLGNIGEEMRASVSTNPATGGGNVDSIFTMGQEFNLLSEQGVLCGTEHVKYEDCSGDDLTEVPLKSEFSIGKLLGCVLGGLVIVAAVAIAAAYLASLVFTGGTTAAIAPLIVGGIAAMVGGAAVIAKGISDYNNQTNSSFWKYAGIALLGTTAGAVAGFAIVASPYAAKWLAQQVLLMLPSGLINPVTFNLISGGAMLTAGGITFSNLIFTHFNVAEIASGENPLKDWMIACDATNGESTYKTLSTVSFIASMGIMFLGAGYASAMQQADSYNVYDSNMVKFDTNQLTRSQQKAIESAENIINDHLTSSDLAAALGDLQGNPIAKPGGGYWNHAQEVRDAYMGLLRAARTLAGSLQNPNLSPDARAFIQSKYDVICKYICIIEELFEPYGGIN